MILILLISIVLCDYNQLRYGRYCGLGHYDPYGRPGIDELDRACQVHDICTSRGLLDCYCNQQLYWASMTMNVSGSASVAKDVILRYLYPAMAPCGNHHSFDTVMVIGKMTNPGFNYYPVYEPLRVTVLNQGFVCITHPYDATTRILYENTSSWIKLRFVEMIPGKEYEVEGGLIYNTRHEYGTVIVKKTTFDHTSATLLILVFYLAVYNCLLSTHAWWTYIYNNQ